MDSRIEQLAEALTGFSTKLNKGDRVLIETYDVDERVSLAIARAARGRGAEPFFLVRRSRILREFIKEGSPHAFKAEAAVELKRMQSMDAYIAVRGSENIFESSDIPSEQMAG